MTWQDAGSSLRRKKWIWAVLLLGGGALGYWWQNSSSTTTPGTPRQTSARVERGELRVTVSGSGQAQAESQVDLKPVAAGDAIKVLTVAVHNDQEVTKGQVIAVLDNEAAYQDVRQAQLNVRKANIQLKQTEALYPKKTREHERQRQLAEVSVSLSQIALQEAGRKLDTYTIRAPFDGIVTGLSVESGDTISQTNVLASVIKKSMKAVITLNEVDAAKVKIGDTATLSFDALPQVEVTGVVAKLDTIGVVTQGVVSYGAEITLDQTIPNLKPGMSTTAEILIADKQNVLLVPTAAVTTEGSQASVLVIQGNGQSNGTSSEGAVAPTSEQREITIGISDNVSTEVLDGLREGERVVVNSLASNGTATSTNNRQTQGSFMNIFRGGAR